MSRIGILPLGRPTFDVSFAEACLARMLEALDRSGHEIVGPRELLFDAAQARRAVEALGSADEADIHLELEDGPDRRRRFRRS